MEIHSRPEVKAKTAAANVIMWTRPGHAENHAAKIRAKARAKQPARLWTSIKTGAPYHSKAVGTCKSYLVARLSVGTQRQEAHMKYNARLVRRAGKK